MSPLSIPFVTGSLERYPDFASAHVQPRHVDVWLPPGYTADPTRRYPVLYAHDGQNLFQAETAYGGVAWSVAEIMTRLIQTGEIQPALVVGLWNTPLRWREYMPQRAFARAAGAARLPQFITFAGGPPISDAYLRCLTTEVKPMLDATYRTLPNADQTFIMGSSMGGLISAYALCEYPTVFGAAACLSTHWVAGDGIVVDYLAAHLPRPGRHRLYFDHGSLGVDAGYAPYQQRVDGLMRGAGYTPGRDWLTQTFPGTDHNEAAWRDRLHIPLRFLLGT